tara:strand:- start:526 stop:729 length:204 start_codon:yes stop_codon:yes gene_type:complete
MNPHNPPIPESGPTFSDMCAMLDGCLNGDIFKFGPLVGGILIFIEIMCWSFLGCYIVKKIRKKEMVE